MRVKRISKEVIPDDSDTEFGVLYYLKYSVSGYLYCHVVLKVIKDILGHPKPTVK